MQITSAQVSATCKKKVATHDVNNNFVPDSAWNAKAYLNQASIFPATNIFDPTSRFESHSVKH